MGFVRGLVEFGAACEGAGEGEVVDEFEVAAHWYAAGEAGDAEAWEVFEEAGEVACGGFAFGVWVGGDDDFFDGWRWRGFAVCPGYVGECAADALEEGGDVEFFWPDAVEWVECAAEDVVAPAVFCGSFDDLDVFGFFYDTDDGGVSGAIGADAAGFFLADVFADSAEGDAVLEVAECVLDAFDVLRFDREEVQGDALRAFWPYAWQSGEFVYDVLEWTFEHGLSCCVVGMGGWNGWLEWVKPPVVPAASSVCLLCVGGFRSRIRRGLVAVAPSWILPVR